MFIVSRCGSQLSQLKRSLSPYLNNFFASLTTHSDMFLFTLLFVLVGVATAGEREDPGNFKLRGHTLIFSAQEQNLKFGLQVRTIIPLKLSVPRDLFQK